MERNILVWKGIMCQKLSGATVKHAKQKTVKWQENTVSSEADIHSGNNSNQN
jgi:hypothetical protein